MLKQTMSYIPLLGFVAMQLLLSPCDPLPRGRVRYQSEDLERMKGLTGGLAGII